VAVERVLETRAIDEKAWAAQTEKPADTPWIAAPLDGTAGQPEGLVSDPHPVS